MSLRFFADHCVPNSVATALRNVGCEVRRLTDLLPANAVDDLVIQKAQELDCILLSLNGDFCDIVRYPPSRFRGIIGLQVKNHPEVIPTLMERLTRYLGAHPEMSDYSGKLLVVEVHRIRIRE